MKERAAELRAEKARGKAADKAEQDEKEVLARIAEMPKADRDLAERVHEIVKESAPDLTPRTWYGMPAYAKDGKTICFFQPAAKFKARYSTLGFNDPAHLDDGDLWATAFAVSKVTGPVEKKMRALIKQAFS